MPREHYTIVGFGGKSGRLNVKRTYPSHISFPIDRKTTACSVSLAGSPFCLFTQWHKNKVCVGTEPVGLGVGKKSGGGRGGGNVLPRLFLIVRFLT